MRRVSLVAMMLVALALAALALRMGSKRTSDSQVLLRVSSPDGTLSAVCQEVPGADGPDYVVRLEREDGTFVRKLFDAGAGEPCSEIVWSKDGSTLGVLSAQVARAKFVDVEWVVKNASDTRRTSWREVSFGRESETMLARGLRFIGPLEVELDVCPYRLADRQRDGFFTCTAPAESKRFAIPQPLLTAQY